MREVYNKIRNMEQVKEAEMMTGPYDIMAVVRADEMSTITDFLLSEIRNIKGVKETTTNVFIERPPWHEVYER
ncbi:hypothetical protein AKJ45_01500 [candidate division MSBL1 archaeon SCGC-AAA261F19]|uniref:Transcription regulator AsnC/Lrp ligand binding domain-containing protein n=1 Tax=candidate division MSBL1 archaeon SCGC-AAA261F19 TaxID=1698275 RepID=A0A133VAL1_9EURY|nr:hypothetical protein AKJ45_01500 [candidate division MSBL1 archaeon SCGC-AAA261F19]